MTGQTQLQRNTLLGLAASLLLAAGKLVAGIIGHSTALIADAVESFADTIGSIVVFQALRVADRPPDPRHPYGYGKAEALATLAVGLLLLLAAALICIESIDQILTPHAAPATWTLLVLVGVIAIKEALFRLVLRGAEHARSDAARADAWHHRADAITSAAAFVGVSLAIWGPPLLNMPRLVLADEVAAILASGIIVLTAIGLIRPALAELLDAHSHELAHGIAAIAAAVPDVRLVEKLHVRKSGRGHLVDMHLHVAPDMSVQDAHSLGGRVKATIRSAHPDVHNVLIHIEPAAPDDRDTGSS